MNHALLIINTQASRAHKNVRRLERIAQKNNLIVEVLDNPSNLKTVLKKHLPKKPPRIIFGGGDGTVISGIEYALQKNYGGYFGIIPLGTSNYLARNLHISLSPSRALRQALKLEPIGIHMATANKHLFGIMLDMGASVHVSQHVTYDLKKRYGQLAYLISTFKALKTHQPFSYSLTSDSENLDGHCHNILVVNSSLKEQVYLAPDNKLTRPALTVSVYTGKNSLALLLNVFLYIITIGKFKRGIKEFEAREILLKTKPKSQFSTDGEIRGKSPITIKVLSKKINFICPRV